MLEFENQGRFTNLYSVVSLTCNIITNSERMYSFFFKGGSFRNKQLYKNQLVYKLTGIFQHNVSFVTWWIINQDVR